MDRIRGGGWCLLVLVAETMSMRRGVPGGLRMAPAEAHDALGLIPLRFAGARGEWPRPRIPCPTCGDEMVLKWGSKRRPHFSHLPKKLGATRKCSGGGEDLKHNLAKEGLAQYLRQLGPLRFFSHCQLCAAKWEPGSVWPRQRTVETEHRLPNGGVADIAVWVRNETKVVIEVFNTHRTATIDSESARSRPEPWYEVRVDDVLRMLHSTQYYGELECVRPDRVCGKCERSQRDRDTLGNWTVRFGKKHKGTTFNETSLDIAYGNYFLGQLVHEEYWQMVEQLDPDLLLGYANSGPKLAFELPKGYYVKLSSIFRNNLKLSSIYRNKYKNSSLLAFVEYLVNDPDLYAIETKLSSKLPEGINPKSMARWDWARVNRKETVSAKRVGPYTAGTKRASAVTLARFNFHSGKWTNVTTYPRVDDDDGYY